MDGGGLKGFKAGFAKEDITPYGRSICMGGFGFNRKSTGVLHPIYARAVYITDGNNYVLLISCDVVGLFNEFVNQVRNELKREFDNTSHIIICSTHNHEGPDTMGYWGRAIMNIPVVSGVDQDYMNILKDKIKRAAIRSRENIEEISIEAGYVNIPTYLTENIRKYGYKDDRLNFLKFLNDNGNVLGFLVNFGCHPEGLWASNTLISADYPGILLKYLEEHTGAEGVFFSGALGGMVTPNIEEDAIFADRLKYTVTLGEKLGSLILNQKDLRKIEFAPLVHINHSFRLQIDNPKFLVLKKLGIFRREIVSNLISTEINFIKLGDVVFFGAPGELLPSMGFKIRARLAPFRDVFIISLCCDELGYIPSPEEFNDKGLYEYEISMSAGKSLSLEILKSVYYSASVIT